MLHEESSAIGEQCVHPDGPAAVLHADWETFGIAKAFIHKQH